jgi:uncharacterized protein (DUF302 family)
MISEGLIVVASSFDPRQTADRLVTAVTKRGMTVLARIDHAAAAEKVGLTLRPTEVILFGNPRAGTLLMQIAQTIGIDLPLKALVWEDEAGQTWVGYNDPAWLARRHGVNAGSNQIVGIMASALGVVVREASASVSSGGDP